MRMRHAAVVAGLALGLMSGTARAAYVVDIKQDGANVVATGSGSIDISQLTSKGFQTRFSGSIYGPQAAVTFGTQGVDIYSGTGTILGPTSFGGTFATADSTTGNSVGVRGGGPGDIPFFYVPRGYSGGDLGTSSDTFVNTTLATLGLTPGESIKFEAASGSEGLTPFFTINVSAVPLPASAPMFGAALIGLAGIGYAAKRKKTAAAT